MLKPEDRRRISIEQSKVTPHYVLTNYYGVKETDNAKFGPEYELFYELKVGDEIALSVFKWKGARSEEDRPNWSGALTTAKGPGNFGPLPPMRLAYRFGWVSLQAAKAQIQLSPTRTTLEIDATGTTSGLARTLFRLEIHQQAIENKLTLRPIHFFQEEKYRSATVRTNVDFDSNQLTGLREKIPNNYPDTPKIFRFSPVFDVASALLWVRSQPLTEGETESIVVWASNAPYLATVTVLGRDTVKVNGHEERAIKLDLKLNGIDNKMHLKEYKLFKGGRGRLSDNAKRIPLRIEADILSATFSPSSNRRRLNSWPILVATQTVSPTEIGRGCHLLREERYSSWSFISRGILRPLLESIAADVDVVFVNRLRVVTD